VKSDGFEEGGGGTSLSVKGAMVAVSNDSL
jgi:hypothetical protein